MAFTSSYTYEWLQNHYSTFDEERRLLLADRNLEQRTAWEREVDAEYDSDETVLPSRYRRSIFEDLDDDSDSDEDSDGSDDEGVELEDMDVDVDEVSEWESEKENAVPVDEAEDIGTSRVAYTFELERSLAQEAYYIRSEDNLKLEYNFETEEEVYCTIPTDLEAHLCKVVEFTEWSRSLAWILIEDCEVPGRMVALCLLSFTGRGARIDEDMRRLFMDWVKSAYD